MCTVTRFPMTPNRAAPVLVICAGLTLFYGNYVRADDGSYGTNPSGGLVFQKTDSVKMESEWLKIAEDTIDVSFVFKNITDKEVTIKVGFPIPAIGVAAYEGESSRAGIPHDPGFDVVVDGNVVPKNEDVKVTVAHSQRDAASGKWVETIEDISEKFNELGLDAYDDDTGDEETTNKLEKLGAVCTEPDNPTHKFGCWRAQKTYYWDQVFPAGKEIHIHHTYAPWTSSLEPMTDIPNRVWFDSQHRMQVEHLLNQPPFCEDDSFSKAFFKISDKYFKDKKTDPQAVWPLRRHELDYVLISGATWAGPIVKFTLELYKGESFLISFCPIPGLKMRKAGNSFIGTMQNFLPKSDLAIEFVHLNNPE